MERQVLAAPRTPFPQRVGMWGREQFQGPQLSETQESISNPAVSKADGTHPSSYLPITHISPVLYPVQGKGTRDEPALSLPRGAQEMSIQVSLRSWDH